ncbi:MAG TPA: thermosome subunit [Candidatus Woesearchaeota archaeon]|mgnify:CR=1 FL=1|nr:thermosome subunit [Candidatus Woesearchaeota archaeon]
MANQPQQPVYVLPENYSRQIGRDAQRTNILAARIVAETIRTTLGPKGMDKMLVDSMGDVIITNDGVTILNEMEIEHPAAKMMVEIAKTQEEEVGDGTTTAVVIAGELLKKAEGLLEQEIHPTVIAHGYEMAAEKSQEILEKISILVKQTESDILEKIVHTAMTGKGSVAIRETLNKMLVQAIHQIAEKEGEKLIVDIDNIKIEKKTGGGVGDTELIQGVTIDKERVHSEMPKSVKNAKILLLDSALEIKSTEAEAQIRISSPDQLQAFITREEQELKEIVEHVVASGANVVFCQKGIDDIAQYFLSKKGIYACRRVKQSDIQKLAKATGGKIVTNLKDVSESDLGYAGLVEEKKISGDALTFVKDCRNPKAVTLLIRGGTEHVVDEVERAVEDSIGDLAAVIETGRIVTGGGSTEIEIAKELRAYASTLGGREQLAVIAFAEALEAIPRTLAENAGLDPIDTLVNLKAAHQEGKVHAGVDIENGNVIDMKEKNVLEPLKVKSQAIDSASEVAIMILRIDDVIAAGKLNKEAGGPPGGMPPMM